MASSSNNSKTNYSSTPATLPQSDATSSLSLSVSYKQSYWTNNSNISDWYPFVCSSIEISFIWFSSLPLTCLILVSIVVSLGVGGRLIALRIHRSIMNRLSRLFKMLSFRVLLNLVGVIILPPGRIISLLIFGSKMVLGRILGLWIMSLMPKNSLSSLLNFINPTT